MALSEDQAIMAISLLIFTAGVVCLYIWFTEALKRTQRGYWILGLLGALALAWLLNQYDPFFP